MNASTILKNPQITQLGLSKLKTVLATWIGNQQRRRLVYDSLWGGIINSWAYEGIREDYGNGMYNDHNFHYGYWVYAAAVIGALDPSWAKGRNKAWVNNLIRDYANSVEDEHFPFSRSFDWYHGHSWASGLDPSADGKNLESTSEDTHSLYAIEL